MTFPWIHTEKRPYVGLLTLSTVTLKWAGFLLNGSKHQKRSSSFIYGDENPIIISFRGNRIAERLPFRFPALALTGVEGQTCPFPAAAIRCLSFSTFFNEEFWKPGRCHLWTGQVGR